MYNYYDAMRNDILDEIAWNYSLGELLEMLDDPDGWKEQLNDDLWTVDGVTGNASGSYTFNSYRAREYVTENYDLCREALREFCCSAESVADHFLSGDWEWFDVTIRCYILYSVIDSVVDDLLECRDALTELDEIDREKIDEILEAA